MASNERGTSRKRARGDSPARPGQVTYDLGDLKPAWLAWCAAQATKPSDAFRQVVARLTKASSPVAAPELPRAVVKGEGERRTVYREIGLTASEFRVASELAAARGLSVPRWLSSLVRAHITGQPQFGQPEFEALTQSNLELLAIGRNLNQIVKAINTSGLEPSLQHLALIVPLRDRIKDHVASVAELMASNQQRWRVE